MPYNYLLGAQECHKFIGGKNMRTRQIRYRPKVVVQGSQLKVTDELPLLDNIRVD
jgi:hypothetical protein